MSQVHPKAFERAEIQAFSATKAEPKAHRFVNVVHRDELVLETACFMAFSKAASSKNYASAKSMSR